jgi:lipopolysaccharide transport protein LptA
VRVWLALLAVAVPAADHPVEMSARGGLEVDLKAHRGKAKGEVVIRRGDVTVCCDEAEAEFEGDRIQRVECKGRVVIVRGDGTRARADLAVFDARADRVTLSGAAKLSSKEAALESESIVYDLKTDQLSAAGKQSRFRLDPSSKPLELERACPP